MTRSKLSIDAGRVNNLKRECLDAVLCMSRDLVEGRTRDRSL